MNDIAIFTMCKNEKYLFPIWYKYYSKYIPKNNIFVLDHESTDNSIRHGNNIDNLRVKVTLSEMKKTLYNKKIVHNKYKYDEKWRRMIIQNFRDQLYNIGYKVVIFTDTDEIICPNPKKYKDLKEYLLKFLISNQTFVNCIGHEVYAYKDEPLIKWKEKILQQRHIWYKNWMYNKPLIAKANDKFEWSLGFHKRTDNKYNGDKDLLLIHLKRIDYISALKKFIENNKTKFNPNQEKHFAQYYSNIDLFDENWNEYKTSNKKLERIPDEYKEVV